MYDNVYSLEDIFDELFDIDAFIECNKAKGIVPKIAFSTISAKETN